MKSILFSTALPLPRPILHAVLLLLAGIAASCGGVADGPEPPPPPLVAAEVAVIEAVSRTEWAWATGSVEAVRKARPGTKILGRIASVDVKEGEKVARGQTLARLESRDLEAGLAQARAGVDMARARLDNASVHEARLRRLHGRGSVTDKNLEDAVAALRTAQAALDLAEADAEAARVILSCAHIPGPFAGWVVAQHAEEGDMARPGDPLFTLEDLSQVEARISVPESEVLGLAPGDPAK
ncbi:MAG: efflux RND transporter periplasmic adaptor subunit, partial [Holophagales bacterium]|nr:efflux RND transporter periplasmic adaptor subunit [Holophagales bacterium]